MRDVREQPIDLQRAWITGFGTFPGVDDNPSIQVAESLARELGAREAEILPVSWGRALRAGPSASVAIHVGVATRRRKLCVERLAFNEASAHVDVEGQRNPGPLFEGAPMRLVSALPCAALARALSDTTPARASGDAGRYLCNARLYASLYRRGGAAVFIHIPPTAPSGRSALGRAIARALTQAWGAPSSSSETRPSS